MALLRWPISMFGLPSRSAMVRATAHERNIADGVVRRTERPRRDDRGVLVAVETVVEGMGHVYPSGFDGNPLVEKVDHLFDVGGAQHIDAIDYGGLPGVLDGQDHSLLLPFPRLQGNGQRPANRLETSVQRQLPEDEVVLQFRCPGNLLRRGQNADGQGQVVCRTLLADVGR